MMQSCKERKRMIIWRLFLIFSLSNSTLVFASHAKHLCLPDQKDALWEFKSEFYIQGFYVKGLHSDVVYVDEKTERWRNNTDCCSWDGVSCDPKTGMVVELNLLGGSLNGPLRSNSSLFRLQHLQNLDLTMNNIYGVLPDSIGNLKRLSVLNLAIYNLYGKIPSSLGNLSHLTDLDLSANGFTGELPDSMGHLNRLTTLQLDGNKLSGNFPLPLLNLSSLTEIDLGPNQFQGMLPSNMSSLSNLEDFDISGNSFHGPVPSSLFMIPSLTDLRLGRNHLSGPLEIGNISSPSILESLSLKENNFSGPISRSISKLVGLTFLDLSFWNTARGMVDFNIFLHLKSLEKLHLSHLNTSSMVDLSVFSHLMLLTELDLSGNNLKISSTLHLPSPIWTLSLSSCNISEFPRFLQNLTRLGRLDISTNRIKGQVPEWLWSLPELWYVNISQNSFSGFEGSPDDMLTSDNNLVLDISSNMFQDLPLLPKSLLHFFGSENGISGEIPTELCGLVHLRILVLSNNNFSGSIPRCFNATLWVLHLQNNSLSGVFPEESISVNLISLDVGHNRLSGGLPKSLRNCTQLEFLNVEDNNFNDTFPFWVRSLPDLQNLVLGSNKFHGPISSPGESLRFPRLRIFDVSKNRFNGVLPSNYFTGWSAMSSVVDVLEPGSLYYHQSVGLANKGMNMELVGSGFTIYKSIDVSQNQFQGDIPNSIGLLKELIVLNMSNNAFTGRIPSSLANLTNLQSLDLSNNRLSGQIPPQLGKLTFLEWMNFSYNRLEGPIPQGTQIQSQNSSAFAENPGLCGVPLQEICGRKGKEEATKQEEDEEQEEEEEDEAFSWIAAAIAYVPGVSVDSPSVTFWLRIKMAGS
ncbi:unnamed protein product [Microthlaspi erraticum]|uniref:Leucine-rich repeat-containing N-terminal plant-type domain-containing protein n=1 Tax=Microthlaspi erraticum TaxID=1685480 RepID=A0A6D2ID50_9BRAS|nr:unnamed protein product [Microthlaspi erraticum]